MNIRDKGKSFRKRGHADRGGGEREGGKDKGDIIVMAMRSNYEGISWRPTVFSISYAFVIGPLSGGLNCVLDRLVGAAVGFVEQ